MSTRHVPGPVPYTVFYIFVFAFQATIMTFFPLHCAALGFTVFQISIISAGENFATLIGPSILMRWKFTVCGLRNEFLSYAVLSTVCFLPILYLSGFYSIGFWWLVSLLFSRALLAMVNQNAVHPLSTDKFHFGRVRVWGSLGFIGALYLVGYLIDRYGTSVTVSSCIVFLAAVASISWLFRDLFVHEQSEDELAKDSESAVAFQQKSGIGRNAKLFLLSVALNWAAHGAIYAYLSLHLERLGWTALQISTSWSIGVLEEVVLFILFNRWEKGASLLTIWRVSTLIGAARFVLFGMTDNTLAICALQVLHAFSFGACYLSSTKLIAPLVPPKKRRFAQAFLTSYGTGLGTLVGKLIAGVEARYFVLNWGYSPLFITSGALALLGYLVAHRLGDVKIAKRDIKKGERGIDPSGGGEAF